MSAGVGPFSWAIKAPRILAEDLMKDAGCFRWQRNNTTCPGGRERRGADSFHPVFLTLLPDKSQGYNGLFAFPELSAGAGTRGCVGEKNGIMRE